LYGCGKYHHNNWEEHPERLEGLLAAMAKTPIKHSLKKLGIINCGVSEKKVGEMVGRQGFTNIKQSFDFLY
jgi:hypothetical protein